MIGEIFLHTLLDVLSSIPFIFIAFLIIEFIEHKAKDKTRNLIANSGKYSPIVASALGIVPQCGFSVVCANLYSGRIITMGTLVAVLISTTDEGLILLLSRPGNELAALKLILINFVSGVVFGYLIDFLTRKKKTNTKEKHQEYVNNACTHCHCEKGIIKASLFHTFKLFVFLYVITFIIHLFIHLLGKEALSNFLLTDSAIQPFLACLVGLIPGCAPSVLITELYLNDVLSFAALVGGLISAGGIGTLVLLKENKSIKENVIIITYLLGVSILVSYLVYFLQ